MKSRTIYLICVSALFVLSVVLGGVLKLFIQAPYYDKVMHFLSTALLFTNIGFLLTKSAKVNPFKAALFAFSFAVMVGVLFEVLEFTIDSLFETNHQHWVATMADKWGFLNDKRQGSGLVDTMGDIIANTLGALIAALTGWIYLRKHANGVSEKCLNHTTKSVTLKSRPSPLVKKRNQAKG